ncbi:MAG: hypothetical protein PUF35_08850 [Subdoligranulum sp.]|nr:hypothetical protein [Subdoligranulum sp.]
MYLKRRKYRLFLQTQRELALKSLGTHKGFLRLFALHPACVCEISVIFFIFRYTSGGIINHVFYTTRAPITPWESRRQPLLQTFLIALAAEHAATFFQPFFLPGLAGSLFLWYHALQK